ncbi:MAG: hypothetical protein EHM89_11250 [Acidobacteria bacterium]|jgi:Metallo-beta-lactamase superfamily|nr:MAG: hypothetical protein EHM89_11250 [Acidobacteriota bacterium]
MKNGLSIVVVAALVTGCAQAPPETQVVRDAAEALGGAARIQAVRTLTVEGEGTAPNVGQNRLPDDELPIWKVTDYQRQIDLANNRARVKQVRTAQFLFAGDNVQRQDVGLDDEVAFGVAPDGRAARAGEQVARDRRVELLHHPLTILRASLDPAAKVANPRQDGTAQVVDVTTPQGDMLTLAVDGSTKLPVRVSSLAYHPNMGDVTIATSFADYEETGGLRLPKRLSTTIEQYPQFDLQVTRNTVDADVGDLSAPADVKASPAPGPPTVQVTVEPVGKGIWWLAGSGNHRSIVFEFDDHLLLFEVPVNEARTKAVIDRARTLSSKPLTHAVVSHHHFDHSGGLRVAAAEGLTLITHRSNEAFFKNLVARKHSIVQDALARNPQPLKLDLVDDERVLKDASMEVRLYHLLDNPREGTNLYAYVPRDRILVQADLYDSNWLYHHWGENVLDNVERRKLRVDRHVPVHGAIQSFADMVKTIKAKPGASPTS